MSLPRKRDCDGVTALKAPERISSGVTLGPTGTDAVVIVERRFQVFALRKQGYSYLEIAETLKCSPSTVRQDMIEVFDQLIKPTAETAEEVREMELARLDKMVVAYTKLATEDHFEMVVNPISGEEVAVFRPPNPIYAGILLKVQERRAKLIALDKQPEKGETNDGIRVYVGVNVDMV